MENWGGGGGGPSSVFIPSQRRANILLGPVQIRTLQPGLVTEILGIFKSLTGVCECVREESVNSFFRQEAARPDHRSEI